MVIRSVVRHTADEAGDSVLLSPHLPGRREMLILVAEAGAIRLAFLCHRG